MSFFSARAVPGSPVCVDTTLAAGVSWPRVRKPRGHRLAATVFSRDATTMGIAAILASTAAFPLSDLGAQSLMANLPPLEVAWLRYLVFFLATLPLLARRPTVVRSARPGLQLLRGCGSAVATIAAIVSFHFLAVPTATAIGFVSPVLVTALAALILKEAVGVRRWSAALVALAGVLIVVQPGGESFRPAALIPLAGAAAGAVTVICTRLNTEDGPSTTVFYSATTGLLLLTGFVIADWQTPTREQVGMALIVGLSGALGTLLQVFAYRVAPTSLLAPFTYTQLIWASGLSFVLVGTVPGVAMLAGTGLIALSALYTAWREQIRGVA